MERHHLITVRSHVLAAAIRQALYGFKKPIMTISFVTSEIDEDEVGVYLVASAPVVQEYVHSCAGFAAGYFRAERDRDLSS